MIVALLLLILKIVFALPKLSPHSYYLETCADQMVDLCAIQICSGCHHHLQSPSHFPLLPLHPNQLHYLKG